MDNLQSKPTVEPGLHPVVAEKQNLRESGKEAGLVHAPIVSVAPQSEGGWSPDNPNRPKKVTKTIDNVIDWLHSFEERNFEFPFGDLEPGQGLFIAKEENRTVDSLIANVRKQVHKLNEMYSERETNDDGDGILDVVTIERKKRNEDGTIQLDNGVPRVGAASGHLPRMVRYRQFIVRSVVKGQEINDDKMEHDGVIVVRVY